jgi:hypothetical protein
MSAKTREVTAETEGEGRSFPGAPFKITECSISYREAEWGPRILLSFRTEPNQIAFADTEWVVPLFVANAESHENKLRIAGNSHLFWSELAGELSRVFAEGGLVTTVHNFESAGKNQRGDVRGMASPI